MSSISSIERKIIGLETITTRCNCSCVFCSIKDFQNQKHLEKEKIIKQIDLLHENGVSEIAFTGGEVTKHPYLLELISYAKKAGIKNIRIYTNGILLDDNLLCSELVNNGLSSILISLFGSNEAIHDRHSQIKGSYKKTINGIINMSKHKGVKIVVNTPLTSINIKDLENIINLLKKITSNEAVWQISDLSPTKAVCEKVELRNDYNLTKKILASILKYAIINDRSVKIQEFPLCIVFPWLSNTKECQEEGNSIFYVGNIEGKKRITKEKPWYNDERIYIDCCKECLVRNKCLGISKSYLNNFKNLSCFSSI